MQKKKLYIAIVMLIYSSTIVSMKNDPFPIEFTQEEKEYLSGFYARLFPRQTIKYDEIKEEKKYLCYYCAFGALSEKDVIAHEEKVHVPGFFTCDLCHREFDNGTVYKNHRCRNAVIKK